MTPAALRQLLGDSPALEEVRRQALNLLAHGSARLPSLLIEGETGTGKGLLARALHEASPRGQAPFVDVNCAAIPESLLEAELFGHAAGAFSSARQAKPGLVTVAHGGTLFLDEVASLPLALQAKLLSAVEDQRVRPLGSTRAHAVDVWVLSATGESLAAAVHEGRFRRDLYHRLARLSLRLPPLRERGADVLLLARHFLARAAREHGVALKTLTSDAIPALRTYGWPGNVRELANLMERQTLLGDGPTVTAAALELPSLPAAPRRSVAAAKSATPERTPSRRSPRPPAARHRRAIPASGVSAGEPAGRLHPVTVLCIEPAAQTLDSPVLVARGRAVVRDKIEAFGGAVDGRSGPGLVAFFGLDPSEDAPIRAGHAAMAAVTALRRTPGLPPVVTAIDVLDGLIGQREHRGLPHPGDVERALDRLRPLVGQAQPGEVVASAAIRPHLERAFDDAPLPGGGGAARLVRARGAFAGTSRRSVSAFVGRDRELAWLARQVERLEPGQGHAVGLIGEPGVGKSRLLHELHESVASQGVPWIQGRCLDHGTATPLLPLIDLLRRALDAEEPEDIAAALGEHLERVGLESEQHAPFLGRLLGLPGHRLDHLSAEVIRTRTFEGLRRIMQPGGGAVVVAVEDLHWTDRTSEMFLEALVDTLPASPLLLIATYRGGYRPPWIDRSNVTQLALPPLDPAASRSIVADILRTRRADATAAERLVQQAEGNPFFLEELAWSVGSGPERPDGEVPRTIRDTLSARIDRLPAGSQRLLEAASVLGREAPARLLNALLGDRDALTRALGPLIEREFVHEGHDAHGPLYAFKHALTQDVAYGRLTQPERMRLHAAAGQEIARLHAGALEAVRPALVHHAVHAEQWESAYRHLHAAATRAMRVSAFAEAAQLLQQALDALRKLPASRQADRDEFQTSLELWTAYYESRQYARIPELEQRIEPLGRALGEEAQLAGFLVRRAQRLWGRPQPRELLAMVPEVLRLAAPDDVRTRSYACFLAGSASRDLGALPEALTYLEAGARLFDGLALDHPEATAIFPILVNILAWRSEASAILGHYRDAGAAAEEALAVARSIASDSALVFANAFLGYSLLLQGEIARALVVLERALAGLPRGQLANATGFAGSFLAYALALDGQHSRALELLREHFGVSRPEIPTQRTRYLTVTTAAYLAAGRPDDALRELDLIVPIARRVEARGHLPMLLRLRAEALLHYSSVDLDEVQSLCQEAWNLAKSAGLEPEGAHCCAVLGRAHTRAGKIESGRRHLAEARTVFRDLGMEYWRRRLDMEADDG